VPKADRKNRLREAWGLRKENGQKVQVVGVLCVKAVKGTIGTPRPHFYAMGQV
jgi:hypothetical protein